MLLKAAKELLYRQAHDLLYIACFPVAVAEDHLAILQLYQPVIAYSYLMCVPSQVLQHGLLSIKARLAIHYPLLFPEQAKELPEVMLRYAMAKAQFPLQPVKLFTELVLKNLTKGFNRKEEPAAFIFPLSTCRESSCGNDAMQVGVVFQLLGPGMQNADHPGLCLQAASLIPGERGKGVPHAFKQHIVEQLFVEPEQSP